MVDQATLDKLGAGFKKLQGAMDCNSLLKRYLTKDVFEKLKTLNTAMKATLLDIIQFGVENLNSDVGLCARVPNRTRCSLSYSPRGSRTAMFVISTRVRCVRSLPGYLFNPCLTEAQYHDTEEKVSLTLRTLEGELKGTYYLLDGMDKKTQQQLIDDHFLSKEGDHFLQAAIAAMKTRAVPPDEFVQRFLGVLCSSMKTFGQKTQI
ncbi:arginine kinase [Ixodes scapularis]